MKLITDITELNLEELYYYKWYKNNRYNNNSPYVKYKGYEDELISGTYIFFGYKSNINDEAGINYLTKYDIHEAIYKLTPIEKKRALLDSIQ